jgi:hypothetical protein
MTALGVLIEDGAVFAYGSISVDTPMPTNWCDVPCEIGREAREFVAARYSDSNTIVQARFGPQFWDRSLIDECKRLLDTLGRDRIELAQLASFDLERIKAGEPFRRLMALRDAALARFFSVRVESPEDGLWVIEHTPAHAITIDAPYDEASWKELLNEAEDSRIGVLATARAVNGDAERAKRLVSETPITGFAWPTLR